MDFMIYAQAVEETTNQAAISPDLLLPIVASAFGGAIISSIVAVLLKVHDSKAEQRKRAEDLAHERKKREEDLEHDRKKRSEDFEVERKRRAEDLEAEHQRWVREQKLEIYSRFGYLALSCMQDAGLPEALDKAKESRTEILVMYSSVRMFAPTDLRKLAFDLTLNLQKLLRAAPKRDQKFKDMRDSQVTDLQKILGMMQKDLGITH